MTNRLAGEASAYLRQHADNPVEWYPWREEAFRRARELDTPILLSIGYSACHWCHVMAHESFEDPDIARIMNEGFVCIKVDREERPDVDTLYQGVVQLMGRSGGWPLTVFLTPDLEPFFGGTYFPPDDRFGVPGLPRILGAVMEGWKNRRAEIMASAGEFAEGLRSTLSRDLGAHSGELTEGDLVRAGDRLATALDAVSGGFGGAPKFPHPAALDVLLRAWRRSDDEALVNGVFLALDRMAEGGLFDQIGGGFHRYSTDAAWRIPHFEKMLYDNAQLVRLYAEAWTIRPSPLYARAVAETVAWLEREMRAPDGAFFSSQDADSEGEEGRFFVWAPHEVSQAVGAKRAPLVCRRFGVDERGNVAGGRTVLSLAEPIEAIAASVGSPPAEVEREIEQSRRLLFEARERRVRPGRDEKILAGWNGLVIGALAKAARVLDRPEWARLAAGAADFVLSKMRADGRLGRAWAGGRVQVDGMLEDYGDLAEGLVQLFMATFEPRYLEAAADLADRAKALFWDESAHAFLAAPNDAEKLPVRVWAVHDDAWPSGASTLCEALVMLAALTGEPTRLDLARCYLEHLREPMIANPLGFGRLWCAAAALLDGAPALIIAGPREAANALIAEPNRRYLPTVALAWAEPGNPPPLLRRAFEGKDAVGPIATAYLCRSFTCEAPAESKEILARRLEALALS